jgi:hypothetical protein
VGRWVDFNLGPGWEQTGRAGEDTIYTRHIRHSNGSVDHETVVVHPDGSSMWIKANVIETNEFTAPGVTTTDTTTTYTRHANDGTIEGESETRVSESVDDRSGARSWGRTSTDEQGDTTLQKGSSFEGPNGGDESVTTTRSDGTTRVDHVRWDEPNSESGTRETVVKDGNGVVSANADNVVKSADGHWTHDPDDDSDDPGDDPGDISGQPTDETTDDDDGGFDGGDFGPSGPSGDDGADGADGSDASDGSTASDSSDDSDDSDDTEASEDGPGEPIHQHGPIIAIE